MQVATSPNGWRLLLLGRRDSVLSATSRRTPLRLLGGHLPIIVSCLAMAAYPRNPSALDRCSVCHMPAIYCRRIQSRICGRVRRPLLSSAAQRVHTLGLTHASPPFDTDRGRQCSQTLPQESALQLHAPPPVASESLPCLSPPTRPSSSVSLPSASYMASPVFLESCSGG
jgi:hypothetical protein